MAVSGRDIARAAIAFITLTLSATAALAQCGSCQPAPPACTHNCAPPPSCCAAPPVVTPPRYTPAPSVSVNVGARASATSIAIARSSSADVVVRTGGGGVWSGGAASAAMGVTTGALMVGEEGVAVSEETRMLTLRAVCVDARGRELVAAQTFGAADVRVDFAGELYRCMPAQRLRYTIDGRVTECALRQALWHEAGTLSCRSQSVMRADSVMALIDRYGYGEKQVAIRAVSVRSGAEAARPLAPIALDGGVGQGLW